MNCKWCFYYHTDALLKNGKLINKILPDEARCYANPPPHASSDSAVCMRPSVKLNDTCRHFLDRREGIAAALEVENKYEDEWRSLVCETMP